MKSGKCKVPGAGSGALSTFCLSLLTFVAFAGCASRGRLRESSDPGFRRTYAASPATTFQALRDALRELGFPVRSEDPSALSLTAGVDWTIVAARGRFEADLPVLAPADLICRIEPGSGGDSLLAATVAARAGSTVEGGEAIGRRRGDVVMIVFNRTQDHLRKSP